MRRWVAIVTSVGALLAFGVSAASAGVSSGFAFYVDDVGYRTVATPTDLSHTGAPDRTYDNIYTFGDEANMAGFLNVAEAAPGDRDFNGGRWKVMGVGLPGGSPYGSVLEFLQAHGPITNDADLLAFVDSGDLVVADTGVRFVCTVNRVPGN